MSENDFLTFLPLLSEQIPLYQLNVFHMTHHRYKELRFLACCREGRSNAHIKGDYQRIGDVMLKNFQGLKVRLTSCTP